MFLLFLVLHVDGLSVGDVGESTLSDRLVLGEGGFISITVAVEAATGRAVSVWGMVIDRLENGRVQDTRILIDAFGLFHQLTA